MSVCVCGWGIRIGVYVCVGVCWMLCVSWWEWVCFCVSVCLVVDRFCFVWAYVSNCLCVCVYIISQLYSSYSSYSSYIFQYIHAIEQTKLVANNYVQRKVKTQSVSVNLDSNWLRMGGVVRKFILVSISTVVVKKSA